MPRVSAKTALYAILVWLALALVFHLKSELWPAVHASPAPPSDQQLIIDDGPQFSDGGNEPIKVPVRKLDDHGDPIEESPPEEQANGSGAVDESWSTPTPSPSPSRQQMRHARRRVWI